MFILLTITVDEWNLIVAALSLFATLITASVATVLSIIAYRLSHRMARNDLLFEVRSWGDQVVDLLSRAFALCELDPDRDQRAFFASRHELIYMSSALLDRGRFFFPNVHKESYGTNKQDAYKGFRANILDLIKLAYELVQAIDYEAKGSEVNAKRREAFIKVRACFVSVIQKAVDFRTVPTKVLDYERHVGALKVPELPAWIRREVRSDVSFGNLRWGSD